MTKTSEQRRIQVYVDEDLYRRMDTIFQWGERNSALVKVFEWMCDCVETFGKEALIIFLRGGEYEELMRKLRERE